MKIALLCYFIITAREANKEKADEHPGIQSPSKSGLQGSKSGKHITHYKSYDCLIFYTVHFIDSNKIWCNYFLRVNKGTTKAHCVNFEPGGFDFILGSRAPQKVQFVDQMTRVLSDHLPDLWRLGQAYFSGKLHKDVRTTHHCRKEHTLKFVEICERKVTEILFFFCFQVKDKNSKVDSSKQKHFKVISLLKNYSSLKSNILE